MEKDGMIEDMELADEPEMIEVAEPAGEPGMIEDIEITEEPEMIEVTDDSSRQEQESEIEIVEEADDKEAGAERNGIAGKIIAGMTLPLGLFGVATTTIPEQPYHDFASKPQTEIVRMVENEAEQYTIKDFGSACLDIADQVSETLKEQSEAKQLEDQLTAAWAQESLRAPVNGDPPDPDPAYEFNPDTNTLTIYVTNPPQPDDTSNSNPDDNLPDTETVEPIDPLAVEDIPIAEDSSDEAPSDHISPDDDSFNDPSPEEPEEIEIFEEPDINYEE